MRARSSLLFILLPVLASTACSDSGTEAEADQTELMKQATQAYQEVEAALADGFVQLSECVASPAGGMGFHYGNPVRIADAVVDPELPEVLLYAPAQNGALRLVGVEFMVHEAAWQGAGNSGSPVVAGQAFDPPNPNHPDPNLREFYTLHAWVWLENPNGVFAPFNPSVSCD